MRRFLPLVTVIGAIFAGCAGVLDISDVHPDELSEAGVTPADAEPLTDVADAGDPDREVSPVVEAGTNDAAPDAIVITGKRVFVTSGTTTAKLGGARGADTICNAAASNAELGGAWIAWLSTEETDAIEHMGAADGPWTRLDGKQVAISRAQLTTGVLSNPIALTEHGEAIAAAPAVWTATGSDGTLTGATCNDWKDGTSATFVTPGIATAADATWTEVSRFDGISCNSLAHLYCFEK